MYSLVLLVSVSLAYVGEQLALSLLSLYVQHRTFTGLRQFQLQIKPIIFLELFIVEKMFHSKSTEIGLYNFNILRL